MTLDQEFYALLCVENHLQEILPPSDFVFDRDEFEATGKVVYHGPCVAVGVDENYLGASAAWTPERGLEFEVVSTAGPRYSLDAVRDFLGDLMQTVVSINYQGMYDDIPDEELPHPRPQSLRRRAGEIRRTQRKHDEGQD